MSRDPIVPDEDNPETAPFWQAAREGRLLLRRCRDCSRTHWYPRDVCPHCFAAGTEWFEASGEGEIYTYTVTGAGSDLHDVMAYVELAEGPRMITSLVGTDPAELAIGQRVRVLFQARPAGPPVPVFRPL